MSTAETLTVDNGFVVGLARIRYGISQLPVSLETGKPSPIAAPIAEHLL